MPTDVLMPKLADTLVEGTLARWLKSALESVQAGEAIAEIETDKVTTELIAPTAGTLSELLVKEGETVPIGTPLVRILAAGEDERELSRGGSSGGRGVGALAPPAGEREDESQKLPVKRASPLAARIAQVHGVNLAHVESASGRITRSDVERHLSRPAAPLPPTLPIVSFPAASQAESEIVPLSNVRKAMATRMALVHQVPTGTAVIEADFSEMEQDYKREREGWLERENFPLTYTPYFLHALAQSLKAQPAARAVWHDGKLVQRDAIHLGVAVALEEGLIVPVLRDADQYGFVALARAQADLVARARSRRLKPADVTGGIATLTNIGTMGGLIAFPMLNEQQSIILGIGTITRHAVGGSRGINYRSHAYLSLTFDRRALDDLQAERFLLDVARRINETI
jgi:pyruvate/2-oxoglutarate dehydrogenase complex dihydrolipoamide acyltransferase (E2) component